MPDDTALLKAAVVTKRVPTFYFVGVTTGGSSIMNVFPRWMEALAKPEVVIEGIDHPLHDEPAAYRRTVAQIRYDPLSLGALVTSHKISLLEAAGDLFDVLDSSVRLTGELSCISKRDGALVGHAKDPLTGGMSLDAVLGPGYFGRSGGHVLNFGAGGSGKAIALHLAGKPDPADRPERFIMVNRSRPRLEGFRAMVDGLTTDIVFETVLNADPGENDRILAAMPEGSVVINATGLGKDLPGSPITDDAVFPRRAVAWEINYRGELDFWHQAKAQEAGRHVLVEDGWLYFVHGWTQHIAEVLHLEMDEATFARLARLAEDLRPPLVYRPRR